MAGVTNAPFRALCRRFGPGLVYVNEMVMATAVVHGNAKTGADDDVRPRRAPPQPADLRLGPRADGTGGRQRVRARPRRSHRPQLRLPGVEGDAQGWWRRRAGAPGAAASHRRVDRAGGGAVRRPGDGEVPPRAARWLPDPPAGRFDLRRRGRRGDRRARPHRRAALRRRRPLGRHRRAEGARHVDPRARQRRHLGGRRRGPDDAGDGVRRRRGRPRLPRPAVAVRRSARGARRPTGAGVTSARVRRRGDGRPRPGARRPSRRRRR